MAAAAYAALKTILRTSAKWETGNWKTPQSREMFGFPTMR